MIGIAVSREYGCVMREPWRPVTPRDEDVPDARIPLEIADALAVHPQHLLPLPVPQGRGGVVVVRALDDQLGGAPRRDAIVEPDALADQLLLDAEVRIGLRDHPHRPPGPVGSRALLAIGEDLVGRERFVAGTEGARRRRGRLAAGTDEHPAAPSRILAQIAHDSATIGNASAKSRTRNRVRSRREKRVGYGRTTLVPSPLELMVKVPAATLGL